MDDCQNLSMLMDFYELTMSNSYFEHGLKEKKVCFDMFFRTVPDHGDNGIILSVDFSVMAGGQAAEQAENSEQQRNNTFFHYVRIPPKLFMMVYFPIFPVFSSTIKIGMKVTIGSTKPTISYCDCTRMLYSE